MLPKIGTCGLTKDCDGVSITLLPGLITFPSLASKSLMISFPISTQTSKRYCVFKSSLKMWRVEKLQSSPERRECSQAICRNACLAKAAVGTAAHCCRAYCTGEKLFLKFKNSSQYRFNWHYVSCEG